MFDDVALRIDHAVDQDQFVGQLVLAQRRRFVLTARIGEFESERADIRLVKRRQDDLHCDVVDVRPFPVSPANMQPHAVCRDAFERLVQSRDMLLDQLGVFHVGHVLEQQHTFHRQVRRVDLQHEAHLGHGKVIGPDLKRVSNFYPA
jgi:hypothetical protein